MFNLKSQLKARIPSIPKVNSDGIILKSSLIGKNTKLTIAFNNSYLNRFDPSSLIIKAIILDVNKAILSSYAKGKRVAATSKFPFVMTNPNHKEIDASDDNLLQQNLKADILIDFDIGRKLKTKIRNAGYHVSEKRFQNNELVSYVITW